MKTVTGGHYALLGLYVITLVLSVILTVWLSGALR